MAALIKHVLSKLQITEVSSKRFVTSRVQIWRPRKPIPKGPKILGIQTRIADRGFLRPCKEYTPPENVDERLRSLFTKVFGQEVENNKKIGTPEQRFALLNDCYKEFNHGVPNSLLHTIRTVGDVYNFYTKPVDTTTPLEVMKKIELPPNLHVQQEPLRFHPDTDTLFGGQTAFPHSSTIVSGIRTRKKYKSYIVPISEP